MNESDFGLKRYLQEIGQFSLLTPQQEIELAGNSRGARGRGHLARGAATLQCDDR